MAAVASRGMTTWNGKGEGNLSGLLCPCLPLFFFASISLERFVFAVYIAARGGADEAAT